MHEFYNLYHLHHCLLSDTFFFYLFIYIFLPVVILKKYTADIACKLQLHLHVYIEIIYNARRSSSQGMYTFKLSSKIKSYIRMYILFLRIF